MSSDTTGNIISIPITSENNDGAFEKKIEYNNNNFIPLACANSKSEERSRSNSMGLGMNRFTTENLIEENNNEIAMIEKENIVSVPQNVEIPNNRDVNTSPQIVVSNNNNGFLLKGLVIAWVLFGGYYFMGGSNMNFLQGDINSEQNQITKDSLEIDTSNTILAPSSTVDFLSENSSLIAVEKEEDVLDSVDSIFLNTGNSSTQSVSAKSNTVVAVDQSKKYDDKSVDSNNTDDYDKDGISNYAETILGTNPNVYDTDGDGLSDFQESTIYRTDPLVIDTDRDGVSDSDEIVAGTDPLK